MDRNANIVEVFISAAQAWPQHTALIHDEKSITYSDLLKSVQKAAGGLQAKGIRKGDAVLVAVPMSIELYTIVLALFYLGAVPVFMDAWVGRKRMTQCLVTVPCMGIIASRKLLWMSWLFRTLRRIPLKSTPAALLQGQALLHPVTVAAHDTALITFTTGSTGPPKAANRTHDLLHAQLDALRPILPKGQDVSFTTLPVVVLLHLAMGKTTVLPPARYRMNRPGSIRYLQAVIQSHEIATLVVSPSVMALLTQGESLPHLQHIITGGGPVFPDLARQIVSRFSQAKATIVFGSTEAEPISHTGAAKVASADTAMLKEWGLPVGMPDVSASVRIIPWQDEPIGPLSNAAWKDLCLPAAEAGEIVVSGPHVLTHYINNPDAEAVHKIQVDGVTWHRTGDAGRMDGSGNLFFLGRCTEMITRDSKTIFPVIAAYQLTEVTGIAGAALLYMNGQLLLVVESRRKIEAAVLTAAMAENGITSAKIIYIKGLPRDPRHLTKVDYAALRKMLQRHWAG